MTRKTKTNEDDIFGDKKVKIKGRKHFAVLTADED